MSGQPAGCACDPDVNYWCDAHGRERAEYLALAELERVANATRRGSELAVYKTALDDVRAAWAKLSEHNDYNASYTYDQTDLHERAGNETKLLMRYCSIHSLDYFADCPQCEADADFNSAPHPSKHYEQKQEHERGTYAEDFDYDDA